MVWVIYYLYYIIWFLWGFCVWLKFILLVDYWKKKYFVVGVFCCVGEEIEN